MIGQFKDKIHFCSGMTAAEKRMAVEFARILGFQSEAAVFPVTDHNKGLAIPKALRELERFCPKVPEVLIPEDYVAASDTALPMPDYDWRRVRGLETLFSKGRLLEDRDLDQIPDVMNLHFVIPEDAEDFVYEAACNLASRYGMDTTAYEGALIGDKEAKGNQIVLEEKHD